MVTIDAIITDLIIDGSKVWIQLMSDEKIFPLHYEFDTRYLSDITKLLFIVKKKKSKNVEDIKGKRVRIIDNECIQNSMIAIGSEKKNRFVDLYGSEAVMTEKGIYFKYKVKEKIRSLKNCELKK